MKNILVVNVNWLGDAVFSTPVFSNLKANFPQSRVTCLCVPRVKAVLEHCPFIDEIIVIDEKRAHFWPWSKLMLISELKCRAFDVAFVLHRSATRGMLVFLSGIPARVGYCKARFLMTNPVNYEEEGGHRSDLYLNVLRAFGLPIKDRNCRLSVSPDDREALDKILLSKGISPDERFVVLHTAGNWGLKRWPAAYFASLIQGIHEQYHVKVLLSGAGAEAEYCRSINQQAHHQGIVIAGETSLGESLALYQRAAVVISSDSGPLHLANSVGAKVIGIYGPTRPEITGPRGTQDALVFFREISCNKAPCYHLACTDNLCMQSVTVKDVQEAVKNFIS